jgi:non-homologous end joining protein Ku
MAPRPNWKGFLKLSLVSCPIALYPAVSTADRVSFRQVNRRTGHRLRHQLVDSVTGEEVDSADKGRGYEIGDDQFLLVEDQDLDRARQVRPQPVEPAVQSPPISPVRPVPREVQLEEPEPERRADEVAEEPPPPPPPQPQNTHTVEIERFVPVGQIDARYFEKPYYITPREPIGQEAFAVIRDAMHHKNMAGLARVVISSRERPILLEPMGNGIRGVTLRFAHEVRASEDYFAEIPEMVLPPEMLKLAEHIIESKTAEFDPSMLEDHYRTALVEILRKKQGQLPPHVTQVKPSAENVVSLMDALRRSIKAEHPKKPPIVAQSKRRPARKGS